MYVRVTDPDSGHQFDRPENDPLIASGELKLLNSNRWPPAEQARPALFAITPPPSGNPLASMKVADLQAYAAEQGIDLGEATKKADILAAIEAAPTDSGAEVASGTPESTTEENVR